MIRGLRLAWTQVRRDLRGREAQIIVLALTLAVTAVVAVGALNDRIARALQNEANQLIAADALVRSSQPAPQALIDQAQSMGLSTAQTVSLPTMIFDEADDSELTMLKAVSDSYPLRGEVRLRQSMLEDAVVAEGAPKAGEIWVSPELMGQLDVEMGKTLYVGDSEFTVSALIDFEPDRSGGVFGLAPRIMIGLDDLEATSLIVPGSRVRYTLMIAGERVDDFKAWIAESEFDQDYALRDVREARPESRGALDRIGTFFSLASMVTVLVAGSAMLISAQDFVRRQATTVAVYRCMGASGRLITQINMIWLFILAVVGFVLGSVLGWLIQSQAAVWLQSAFSVPLEAAPLSGLWRAAATALLTTVGFAYAPLAGLTQVSVMSVLRSELAIQSGSRMRTIISVTLSFAVLVALVAGDVKSGVYMTLGLWGTVLLVFAAVRLIASVVKLIRNRLQPGWRLGLGSYARRGALSAAQSTALAMGVLALGTLSLVVEDLLDTWSMELPADAPNYFMLNIQPDQEQAFRKMVDGNSPKSPVLYPVVRWRLVAINDDTDVARSEVRREGGEGGRRREWNLTFSETPRTDNPTIDGEWWSEAEANSVAMLSVEREVAEDFGISINDRLTFRIAGAEMDATVVHIRDVKWQSLNANFYVIGTPFAFRNQPYTFLTAAYIPPENDQSFRNELQTFPGVSAISVSQMMARVRSLLDQASLAVRAVFGFAVLSGLLVLWSAVHATRSSRAKEVAILRVLGLDHARIRKTLWIEYAVLGGVAGFVGLAIAQIIAAVLGVFVFDLPLSINLTAWVVTLVSCSALTALSGGLALRGVMRTPPNRVLRAE